MHTCFPLLFNNARIFFEMCGFPSSFRSFRTMCWFASSSSSCAFRYASRAFFSSTSHTPATHAPACFSSSFVRSMDHWCIFRFFTITSLIFFPRSTSHTVLVGR